MKKDKIEHKLNKKFTYKGIKYKCIDDPYHEACAACDLKGNPLCFRVICCKEERSDRKNIIYKRVKTSGKKINILEKFEYILRKTSINIKDKNILRILIRQIISNNN